MNRKQYVYGGGSIVLVLVLALVIGPGIGSDNASGPNGNIVAGTEMVVYKSPNCGCCGVYTQYAQQRGFDLDVNTINDVEGVKGEQEVPSNLWSCHTSIVDGYVVEGHMPAEAIEKLLDEQPDIKGIALPGMPSGSPGMPGPKHMEWTVYAIHNDGSVSEFMRM